MNYIGSKYSLIDFLVHSVEDFTKFKTFEDKKFCDIFSGTSIVGMEFKKKGCKVIANDIQYYSYVLAKHFIENNCKIQDKYSKEFNELKGKEGFIFQNYCMGSGSERNYFSDINGKKCDEIRERIENLKVKNLIKEEEYYFYLASLINSIDKYANTASVYGAFLKHIKKSAQKELIFECLPIIIGKRKGKAYNEDANLLIKKIKGDILYLDPPYNSRQYSANYHILETVAKNDNPEIKGKTGLRVDNVKSKWCSKRTVKEVFEDLIKNAKFKYIFLSYNNEGLMSFDEIEQILGKYGNYKLYSQEYKRFRADKAHLRNHKADKTIEYLHCLEKK